MPTVLVERISTRKAGKDSIIAFNLYNKHKCLNNAQRLVVYNVRSVIKNSVAVFNCKICAF